MYGGMTTCLHSWSVWGHDYMLAFLECDLVSACTPATACLLPATACLLLPAYYCLPTTAWSVTWCLHVPLPARCPLQSSVDLDLLHGENELAPAPLASRGAVAAPGGGPLQVGGRGGILG